MQPLIEAVEDTMKRLVSAEPSSDIRDRVVCTCRSRVYQTSCARYRNAVRLTAFWTLTTIALGFIALSAHQRHVRLTSSLYGG